MTGWIIFLSILGFFLLIFFMPAVLDFRYEENKVHVKVSYFMIPLFNTDKPKKEKPQKEKKKKKKKKKEKAKKDDASEKKEDDGEKKKKEKAKEKRTLSEWMELIKMLLHSVKKGLRRLFKGIRFSKVYVDIQVGDFDAAVCAVNYGKIYAGVANGIAFLQQFFRMKLEHVAIVPCFGTEKNVYTARFRVKLSPAAVLAAAFSIGLSFVIQWLQNKVTSKA